MPAKPPPKKKRALARYVFLALLLVCAGGLLWDGSPLAAFAVERALAWKFSAIPRVSPDELVAWTRDPTRTPPLLLDARTEAEYAVSHIDGAIRLDPKQPNLSVLENVSRHTPVVVYSATSLGGTAMAQALTQANFDHASVLAGGIFRWINEGHPVVKDHAAAAEVHPYNGTWGHLLKSRYRAVVPDATGMP